MDVGLLSWETSSPTEHAVNDKFVCGGVYIGFDKKAIRMNEPKNTALSLVQIWK